MIIKDSDPLFIHLRVRSSYSLLEGAITPSALIGLCEGYRMPAVAVTDVGNLFASLEFTQAAMKAGVQPIIGCCLWVAREVTENNNSSDVPLDLLPVIAKDEDGYYNLLKLSSKAFLETKDGRCPHVTMDDISQHSKGLIAFTGGVDGAIGKLLLAGQKDAAQKYFNQLCKIFSDHLYVEITRHGQEEEEQIEACLLALAYDHNIPLVATNDVYFATSDMFEAHDALRCIAAGKYLGDGDREQLTEQHYFKSSREMVALFQDIPEAIESTIQIAKRCSAFSPSRDPILPHFPTEGGRSEDEELKAVSRSGLEMRIEKYVFPQHEYAASLTEEQKADIRKEYSDRLEYELGVISQMGFPGYFLIVSDFIRWSKRNNIPVGPGRGSGAGSLVAWSLEITDLDPIRFGLLFERFLNPERVSMPDFDVDFCQYRRDEVIRYVQEKYGRDQVAQIITFGKLQARAVLRDVGRVLEMPYPQVDRICKLVPNNPAAPVTLGEALEIEPDLRKEYKQEEEVKRLVDISLKLEGLNRHASTHAAGVVIGDRQLDELIPLYRDPRSDMPVTQYSMKYAEQAGLVKFDFLGLKTLTIIKQAEDLVREKGIELDISTIPLNDKKTFEMLGKGDSIGVFQLESAGMRDTLYKMKPDRLEELIALISLYRPGPMDNIPTYIACKQGDKEPDYLHPMLEDILKETYGVIIYQEQVMQIAQVLSGYTLGGADLLRRAMGKKIKEEMDEQRELFVDGAVDNNVDKKQADGIFDLVAKFAGYGFNKSHAAAYALISYQTAYLKANYPVEFYVANMNLDSHDTDKLNIFKEDVVRHDIPILSPDINASNATFSIACDDQGREGVRYALGALKNVGEVAMELVVKEREENGNFKDIFDFAARCDRKVINKKQLEYLTKAGAFDYIHPNRHQLVEGVEVLTRYAAAKEEERDSAQVSLFGDAEETESTLPILPKVEEWPNVEKLSGEYSAFGFFLKSHPLDAYDSVLESLDVTQAVDIEKCADSMVRMKLAGIVTAKKIKNSQRGKYAFLQLSDSTGLMEISIFNEELLSNARDYLDDIIPLLVEVDVRKDDGGGVRLIVDRIAPIEKVLKRQNLDVYIYLNSLNGIGVLKHKLSHADTGNASLFIRTVVDEAYDVEINLNKKLLISPGDISDIEKIEGIFKVESIAV